MIKRTIILLLYICSCFQALGQIDVSKFVTLDSITIAATKKGFDVADFIELIKEDTSFTYAFMHLRLCDQLIENDFVYYDRKENEIAKGKLIKKQIYQDDCRWMEDVSTDSEGKFFKRNGEYRFFTSALFADAFFTEGKICSYVPRFKKPEEIDRMEGMEKRKQQLKTLIFNPGASIDGIPIIKERLAIFDEKMIPYYDYAIETNSENETEYYVFKVSPKTTLSQRDKDYIVLHELETWFSRKDFKIHKRNYQLKNKTALFDFDVDIKVQMQEIDEYLIPEEIEYDGYWKIPMMKAEKSKQLIRFSEIEF